MSKANFKHQPSQETLDKAIQDVQQALQEIQGAIDLLQTSANLTNASEVLPETIEEVQGVLDRVLTEFQALDQELVSALSQNNPEAVEAKLLDWFNHRKQFRTSA